MTVQFYDNVDDSLLKYAVIISRIKDTNQWVFCKHRQRNTLEIPGGHRETGENILDAAKRELYEETGAVNFSICPVCVYSIIGMNPEFPTLESFGMLYYAEIQSFEQELHSEIEKVYLLEELPEDWTYPEVHPKLIAEAIRRNMIDKSLPQ